MASRAAYMRKYRKDARAKDLQKAYRAGFQALKTELTAMFMRIGKGELTGYTALEIVRNSSPDVPRGTSVAQMP